MKSEDFIWCSSSDNCKIKKKKKEKKKAKGSYFRLITTSTK
jgi:hypothetical protein